MVAQNCSEFHGIASKAPGVPDNMFLSRKATVVDFREALAKETLGSIQVIPIKTFIDHLTYNSVSLDNTWFSCLHSV